jgi:HPt (histidine-containing phosphotransfer) domain-containing protein
MNRLWVKYLPELEARVATLETAATALAAGALTEDLQEQATLEAHKLAGVLGTFGLHQGTDLAREAENAYRGDLQAVQIQSDRLAAIAAELKGLLASRR